MRCASPSVLFGAPGRDQLPILQLRLSLPRGCSLSLRLSLRGIPLPRCGVTLGPSLVANGCSLSYRLLLSRFSLPWPGVAPGLSLVVQVFLFLGMQAFRLCFDLPPRALWHGCLPLIFQPVRCGLGHYSACRILLFSSAPTLFPWPGLVVGRLLVFHGSFLLEVQVFYFGLHSSSIVCT
ncbi:hypothetical protein V6N13_082138 [Hibiscus sabdariffa]